METKNVKMSTIYPDLSFNSRKIIKGIPALAEDMGKNGQLVPIIVTKGVITEENPGKGKHLLIAGYRRYLAAQKLGWTDITVQYIDLTPYSKDAALTNMRENFARHDLTTFDQASSLLNMMESYKMKDKELAETFKSSINLSYKHVNNLVNARKRLHPDILTAWQEGHELATTVNLFSLYGKDQDSQLEAWKNLVASKGLSLSAEETAKILEERKKEKEEEKAAAKARGEAPAAKIHKPSEEVRKTVFGLIGETKELSEEVRKAARAVLLWVDGTPSDLVIAGQLVYSAEAEKQKGEQQKLQEKMARDVQKANAKAAVAMARAFANLPAVALEPALAALPDDMRRNVKAALEEIAKEKQA